MNIRGAFDGLSVHPSSHGGLLGAEGPALSLFPSLDGTRELSLWGCLQPFADLGAGMGPGSRLPSEMALLASSLGGLRQPESAATLGFPRTKACPLPLNSAVRRGDKLDESAVPLCSPGLPEARAPTSRVIWTQVRKQVKNLNNEPVDPIEPLR